MHRTQSLFGLGVNFGGIFKTECKFMAEFFGESFVFHVTGGEYWGVIIACYGDWAKSGTEFGAGVALAQELGGFWPWYRANCPH